MLSFNSSTDLVFLNSQLLPYTFCGWAKLNVVTNNFSYICFTDNTAVGNGLGIATDGVTLTGLTNFSNALGVNGSITLTVGQFFFWAISRNNTDNFFTWYHSALGSNTITSITELGADNINNMTVYLGYILEGSIGVIKKFNRQLFAPELLIEKESIIPRSNGCVGFWPTIHTSNVSNAAIDYSGNGLNLSISGTLTSEENPPIPWGSTWFPGSFEEGLTPPIFTRTNAGRGNFLIS